MNINRAFFTDGCLSGKEDDKRYLDKNKMINEEVSKMYLTTLSMFKYKNLPEEIDPYDLEFLLQYNGSCVFTKHDKKYYVFTGGLGGELNAYYHPTKDIVANPFLKLSKEYTIQDDKDAVLIKNDYFYMGLNYINLKYARMYVESVITSLYQLYNARIPSIASSDDSQTTKDLETLFNNVADGKTIKVVGSSAMLDGVKTNEFNKNVNNMKDVMELQQYYRSMWLIEIGLNANYNMKRESINDSESAMNTDCLLPFCDMMYQQRKRDFAKINKKYGLNIEVEFNSSWNNIREEVKKMIDDSKEPIQEESKEGDLNEDK